MGGTNDARFGIAVDQVIDNIREMVEQAVQKSIIPILGLPIPCKDLAQEKLLGQYRVDMRQYAGDNNIEVIEFHQAMIDEGGVKIKEGLLCDDVHPSIAGYEVMADVAAEFLVKVLSG